MLALILAVATILRAEKLGKLSYWYDEVVTIRIATAPDIPAMLALLEKTDATRAILHPLLLHGWVRVFGSSEAAARAFSVVCGVLTVAWVARLGRILSGQPRTGLWAAWLAALSPMLILYSREVRMYALVVLLSCVAWDALLALRHGATFPRLFVYSAALTALMYSHSLGLLMASALALASVLLRRDLGLSWIRWLAPYVAAAVATGPWIGRYFDHAPEYLVGPKSIIDLIATPLPFIGGQFKTLFGFLALIVAGLLTVRRNDSGRWRIAVESRLAAVCLLCWLLVPPLLLFGYAWFFQPIFGLPRYTIYVAPAYFILVAHGLGKLPGLIALAVGLASNALLDRGLARLDLRARPEARLARRGRGPGPSRPLAERPGAGDLVSGRAEQGGSDRALLSRAAPQGVPVAGCAGPIAAAVDGTRLGGLRVSPGRPAARVSRNPSAP